MKPRFAAAALAVIGLLGSGSALAFAANAGGAQASNARSGELATSGSPVPEATWSLGIAVIGVVVVLRRKKVV